MTWEQKLAACQALGECHLMMRKPGDWYVSQRVSVKEREGDGVIVGRYGNGATPEEAAEDHFNELTAKTPLAYVVIDEMRPARRHVRWNGFMWEDVGVSAPRGVGA
jgi:hypothetical protein